ncbi:MAG: ATP-binding protein [Candidatus Goldbacteria bacterium]|nr:ATP-binding protein [Candidatus Goldiibacteriota bacterium]
MPNKAEVSELKVDAKAQNLGVIRKFINAAMKNNGFAQDKISAMKVSITEHIENLIRHAYAEKPGKTDIIMKLEFPSVKITVLDSGAKFDMTTHEIPDTSRRLKKGLGGKMGIKTIMALCDKVVYKRKGNYNENTFIIRQNKKGKVNK